MDWIFHTPYLNHLYADCRLSLFRFRFRFGSDLSFIWAMYIFNVDIFMDYVINIKMMQKI